MLKSISDSPPHIGKHPFSLNLGAHDSANPACSQAGIDGPFCSGHFNPFKQLFCTMDLDSSDYYSSRCKDINGLWVFKRTCLLVWGGDALNVLFCFVLFPQVFFLMNLSPYLWPNSGFLCFVFLTLWIPLLSNEFLFTFIGTIKWVFFYKKKVLETTNPKLLVHQIYFFGTSGNNPLYLVLEFMGHTH
jgi:hypothetical protein